MIDFLLSVPGRCTQILNGVNTLLTNWTSTRAAYLDAAISSRAPANTALSTAVWTTLRATALDSLAAVAANITTMLQRPTLSAPTTLTAPSTTGYTAGKRAAMQQIDGIEVSATVSPGAGAYSTVINEVGRGIINFLGLAIWVEPPSGTKGWRITIDGNVFTGTIGGSGAQRAACVIGAMGVTTGGDAGCMAFENLTFLTGFKVEFTNSVAGGQFLAYHRYRRTG
jgi:hypothetical protein